MFRTFLVLGVSLFGGPAVMLPFASDKCRRLAVVDEQQDRRALALSQILPGATVIQYAAIVGWMYAGLAGSLSAFAGMALPGVAAMLVLTAAYLRYSSLGPVTVVFGCLQAVVLVVLLQALRKMSAVSVSGRPALAMAAGGLALMLAGVNSELVLLAGALAGVVTPDGPARGDNRNHPGRIEFRLLRYGLAGGCCLAVIGCLAFAASPLWGEIALDMIKVSLLSFGGGYTAAALFYDQAVVQRHWLDHA
ncbi:MAG: chromate transporter, partial [Negativicutes bacterium]|nr:chromate transporter [Negativicutes bacterium]